MSDNEQNDYGDDAMANAPDDAAEPGQSSINTAPDAESTSKTKRIACILCRKRKLRCDGARPACGTCKRLSHNCTYDEVRRKSGPKRGYVKALEARLHQVETLLKTQDNGESNQAEPKNAVQQFQEAALGTSSRNNSTSEPFNSNAGVVDLPGATLTNGSGELPGKEAPFPWEMIGLGLDEPLPLPEVIDELHQIYFDKVHPTIGMIHRRRYLASLNLAPHMRPPVCLRYIMWCLAASVSDKYDNLQDHFYQRARKYIQADEMKGHGEQIGTPAHCQTWVHLMIYEFKMMYFPRAWLSAGRATRLAQMMGLHRLDGVGLDVKQCIPPPKDWTEREEWRRTFWQAFCGDRYASIGTGWPMMIDERDILTDLPSNDEAFDKCSPAPTITLQEALTTEGIRSLSSLGGNVLMAYMFGQNLLHLHRPTPHDNDSDINGEFWKRHRRLDAILSNTSLSMPDSLRLPAAMSDSKAIFMNMSLHTSVVCLHQAAIFKADRGNLPTSIGQESKIRCVTAASEVASIMRMTSHMDLTAMHAFTPFCLYVACRVYIQYLKSRPDDDQMRSSLQFLLAAMQAFRRRNPLTESFLAQMEVDLEGSGIIDAVKSGKIYNIYKGPFEVPRNTDSVSCSPLLEIRQSQKPIPRDTQNGVLVPQVNLSTVDLQSKTPGPPFHVSDIHAIDMSVQSTPYSYNSGDSVIELPSREKPSRPGAGAVPSFSMTTASNGAEASTPSSDMDTSPDNRGGYRSPSTGENSHRASSQSSFSPSGQGQIFEDGNNGLFPGQTQQQQQQQHQQQQQQSRFVNGNVRSPNSGHSSISSPPKQTPVDDITQFTALSSGTFFSSAAPGVGGMGGGGGDFGLGDGSSSGNGNPGTGVGAGADPLQWGGTLQDGVGVGGTNDMLSSDLDLSNEAWNQMLDGLGPWGGAVYNNQS